MTFVMVMTILSSFFLTPLGNASRSYEEDSDNSDVATWEGHDVGAITWGIRYDTDCAIDGSAVFEVGCSAALGEDWFGDPQEGHYSVELDSITITLEAVTVWKDLDDDDVKDPGEPSGSVNDVRYVDPHVANKGAGSELENLVDLMDDVAELLELIDLIIPTPFSLLKGDNLSPCYTTISQGFGTAGYNAMRGEVKYYGDVDDYIKIKVTTRGDFDVYWEPYDRGGSWVASRTITETNYIYIVVNES